MRIVANVVGILVAFVTDQRAQLQVKVQNQCSLLNVFHNVQSENVLRRQVHMIWKPLVP